MIEETVELMVRAGGKETGGILIGHLHRDPGRRQLFLEVTAQIPAQHAEQELARLTFTPETWTAVDAALALRGKGEIQLGWWHSHPASHWCDDCPPETRRRCKSAGAPSGDFFSAHDVALHRTVFPRAYSIALVLSDGCGNAGTPTLAALRLALRHGHGPRFSSLGIPPSRPRRRRFNLEEKQMSHPERLLMERLNAVGEGAPSLDEKCRIAAMLRSIPEAGQRLDRMLIGEQGPLARRLAGSPGQPARR